MLIWGKRACKWKIKISLPHRLKNLCISPTDQYLMIKTLVTKLLHETQTWGCGYCLHQVSYYLTPFRVSGDLYRVEIFADDKVIKISRLLGHMLVHVCSNWQTLLFTNVHGLIGINCYSGHCINTHLAMQPSVLKTPVDTFSVLSTLKKALDSVYRNGLMYKLIKNGWDEKRFDIIRSIQVMSYVKKYQHIL